MADSLTKVKAFDISQYEEEAVFLTQMRSKGWKFKKIIFPCFYRFEKCEPEEVVYQLDFSPEGDRNKDEYIQMYKDCGWEYILNFNGYSYFCKPKAEMTGDEEIFSDDESKFAMLNTIFRNRIIPLAIIFFALAGMNIMHLPGRNLGDHYPFFLNVLFILYTIIFVRFGLKWYAFKKRMNEKI